MQRFLTIFLSFGVFATLSGACSSSSGTSSGGAAAGDAGADAAEGGNTTGCTSARKQLLTPVDKTSTGEVSIVSDTNGAKLIYVDASAGGQQKAPTNPRVYLDLAAGTAVAVTDVSATTSTAWDLAVKRAVIYTNGGDAGPGQGSAVLINKSFASVTAADADAATPAKEAFFDADCNPSLDPTGAVMTTFSDWYDYDQVTNIPAPKDVTYVVTGGVGTRYKVAITSYSAQPDGGAGQSTGFFLFKVAPL